MRLFETSTGLQYFPEKFRCNLKFYESDFFLIPLSTTFSIPKILGFLFLRKMAYLGSEMRKIKLQKIVGEFL